jgi:hypothetical protein
LIAFRRTEEKEERIPVADVAFTRTFKDAPMLVTSQQPGSDQFITWRLPPDIREFTSDLLRLYLPTEQAEVVMKRIAASGLRDAIRSGYDVRLVIDLVWPDPDHAELPADRIGLYAAVIKAGWPEDVCQEQQNLTAAAAWRMVSERKPNEDMRRLKPDIDLPPSVLTALADAPDNDNRSLRLVRRVGAGAFEFVHDQMHAYLAARWFAQPDRSIAELEKMVATSTIWTQSWPEYEVEWVDELAQAGADAIQREQDERTRNRTKVIPTSIEIARMETAISWPARYLGELPQLLRTVGAVAQVKARSLDIAHAARRLKLPGRLVRRWNDEGLDAIAAGLRREMIAVF